MEWNIIIHTQREERYDPKLGSDVPRLDLAIEPSDRYPVVGLNISQIAASEQFAFTFVIEDLLRVVIATYAADQVVLREFAEDRWTRRIRVHVPVSNPTLWQGCEDDLSRTAGFLTGDLWAFEFIGLSTTRSPTRKRRKATSTFVQLFSGGLDSLIGAIDLLESEETVTLVSHHGTGITRPVQESVLEGLRNQYGKQVREIPFWVQPPRIQGHRHETTMRSRSLLFLALGTAVASALGSSAPLHVAENGLISLNVPFTGARLGSLSTRTTHPHFIECYRRILCVLGIEVGVLLPYRFKTKGEMLAAARNQQHARALTPLTMSCAHPEAQRFTFRSVDRHCGYCVPCIIRRAAMHVAGYHDAPYCLDIHRNPPAAHTGRGEDLRAIQMAVSRFGDSQLQALADILTTGPIPRDEVSQYADVYLRGMLELKSFLYPQNAAR